MMDTLTNSTTVSTTPDAQGISIHQILLWLQVPIGTAIVLENVIILFSLPHAKRIQTSLRVLMANMAIADALVGLVFIYNCIIFYNQHLLTTAVCIIRYGIIYTSIFVSTANVTVMALDRCFTIKFPYKYPVWVDVKKSVIASVISWSVSILMSIAALYRSFVDFRVCVYLIIVKMEALLVPGVVILIYMTIALGAYYFIVREVLRHIKQIGDASVSPAPLQRVSAISTNPQENGPNSNIDTTKATSARSPVNCNQNNETTNSPFKFFKKYMTTTKTVTVILGAYICFNSPIVVVLLHLSLNPHLTSTVQYTVIVNSALFFMVLNSLANPIIYQMRMKTMRIAFFQAFCARCCNRYIRDMQTESTTQRIN